MDVLARDAQAEVRFLARLPGVDPKRVGLLGDSQAGWIIALAAAREPAVHWAVPLAGPTVSVDETDLWGDLAGKSQVAPSGSEQTMLAQVRAGGPGGFDPRPSLRKLSIPALWVFGDDDRNVPTKLCVEALEQLKAGPRFQLGRAAHDPRAARAPDRPLREPLALPGIRARALPGGRSLAQGARARLVAPSGATV